MRDDLGACELLAARDRGHFDEHVAQPQPAEFFGDSKGELDRAGTALTKAQERFDKAPTPEDQALLDAALARRAKSIEGHEDLPEENDSWATGPAAAAGITGGTPAPEPPPADVPAHDVAPEENLPGGGP